MHPTPSNSRSPVPRHRFQVPIKQTDGPSPAKRRRLASPAPTSPSSFSSQPLCASDPQLDAERRASSSRVLDIWSALEDKYARRLDEDDIVDLRSGSLAKDRGVLSGKAGTWEIGCFADSNEARDQVEKNTLDLDEDEDDFGRWDSDQEFDPRFNQDAEDLRAFLAAEEARRAIHGVDDDLSVVGDGFSEEDGDGNEHVAHVETDESIIEVEAGSALALSSTESDDELAGYDDTVGEGALHWEVGPGLNSCLEHLGAEGTAATRPPQPPPRRNQTPAQLITPPLSRYSARGSNHPDLPKVSQWPFRKPPAIFLSSPPLKPKDTAVSISPTGCVQSTSPEGRMKLPETPLPVGGNIREMSVSPTKNLVAEVILPISHRARSALRQIEDAKSQTDPVPRTPMQLGQTTPIFSRLITTSSNQRALNHKVTRLVRGSSPSRGRHSDAQNAAGYESTSKYRAASVHSIRKDQVPYPPPHRAARKRALSTDTSIDLDVVNINDNLTPRTRERWIFESVNQVEPSLSRRRRRSVSASPSSPIASSGRDEAVPSSHYNHPQRRSSPQRPPPAPYDFYPPYLHIPPAFPIPHPPNHNHTREANFSPQPSHADAQLYVAQALQNLSYLAFGAPPPPPPSSSPLPSQLPQTPASHTYLHPPSPWSYPTAYYPRSHVRLHPMPLPPPWTYPPYPVPLFPPTRTEPFPHFTPHAAGSGSEQPSSPPDFSSSSPVASPLSQRGKGKRVSFPQEAMQLESDLESSPDSNSETDADISKRSPERVGEVKQGSNPKARLSSTSVRRKR